MPGGSQDDLEARVGKLETYLKIGVVVAAIFGIGGGFGASAITTANKKIEDMRSAADDIEEDLLELDERVATLITQVGNTASQLTDHARTLENELDEAVRTQIDGLTSIVSEKVSGEIERTLEHRILGFGSISCDLRDVAPVVQWTEVCRERIAGNFLEEYIVFTSINYFYHRNGEVPPIYNVFTQALSSDGFDLAIRLGYGRLNQINVSWLAISVDEN